MMYDVKTAHAIKEVLAQPDLNGVYRLSHAEWPVQPVLDGRTLTDKHSFLSAVGRTFNFPDYYGENWDALEECLSDMSWHNGPIILLIEHTEAIPAALMSTFLEIFDQVAKQWTAEGRVCSLFII
jgi:RNAse (barnase) inhibitor barstar